MVPPETYTGGVFVTAAYEIPSHLLSSVRAGVILAADIVGPQHGRHYGRRLQELTDEWYEKVMLHSRHEDLLKPAEAASLLAVLEIAIKHAIENNFEDALGSGRNDGADLMFAMRSDEIREALLEIVYSDRLVFA